MSESLEYQLVISQAAYDGAMRRLLSQPGHAAVGRVRRNARIDGRIVELLVSHLDIRDRLPRRDQDSDLADWAVLVCPAAGEARDPRAWLRRMRPQGEQFVVVALLGLGNDRSGWDGAVRDGGSVWPLSALRIVGGGMICAERQPVVDSKSSQGHLDRWSRTRGALGDTVWRKVQASSVAVIGASRSGSLAAFQLAALGVRRLTLVDPDIVERHNLDAMWGVTEADVGQPKAEALARRLTEFRPDLAVHALASSVREPAAVERLRAADLLVTCVDRDMPRLATALLASRYLKVHLDIGTGITHREDGQRMIAGDVRLLLPGQGCVSCVGGLPDGDEARYQLLAPPDTLERGHPRTWQEERAGSLVTVNAIAVAAAIQLWLDLLAGDLLASHWLRFRWQPGRGMEVDEGDVGPVAECPICQVRGG